MVLGLAGVLLPVIIITVIVVSVVGGDVKNTLVAAAETPEGGPERIEELIRLSEIGVPWDIVMMITTLQCETEEEAQTKPFIGNALEFMIMTEVISEKHHTCDKFNETGSHIEDEDATCSCDFKVVATKFHNYKEGILGYLGIAGDPPADLNAENLEERLQAAADIKAQGRTYETKIKIQINAIDNTIYKDAIIRCGIDDTDTIDGIIELHESGYYTEWMKERAAEFGLEVGGILTAGGVNGVHSIISNAVAGDTSEFVGGSFGNPIPQSWRSVVSCEFGGYVGHTGIDFAVPIGTQVRASVAGKVIITGSSNTGYGNYIVINHGGGIATLYAHNSQLLVSTGQEVSKGDVIALSGNTGNVKPKPTPENPAAGAHLHFEVIVNGIPKNPRGYLS